MFALWTSVATASPASAQWTYVPSPAATTYQADFGARFWYGWGKTGKSLYDRTGDLLVSRLTYKDHNFATAEAYGRFDLNMGIFLKGYFGGGKIFNGTLIDEDFPPVINPYSQTTSELHQSSMIYGSIDGGFKLLRGPDFHLGAFVGYHFLKEDISAFGCGQLAANPFICGGGIPSSVKVITQDNRWHSLRLGADAAVDLGPVKLSADAAWLPYVWLDGTDYHWLRIGNNPGDFSGGVPEDGKGWGYQLDAMASYRVTDAFTVGVGGRYWHMQTDGHTHFEGHVVGFNASPQVVNWSVDNFGVFFQATLHLGTSPLIGGN